MQLYRLTKSTYAQDLTGTGGLYGPGRWHREGTRLLYTAQHASLAILEILGHTEVLPRNYAMVTLDVPEGASITQLNENDLPVGWRKTPAPTTLADLAFRWILEGKFWVLRVPSVHVPSEFNYLLNPAHPEHSSLRIVSIEPYTFDERLK